MTHMEKLYALIGKLGKGKTAGHLEMTYPTFLERLKNPDDFRVADLQVIDKLYNETFGG
jgi:hypothetical protein